MTPEQLAAFLDAMRVNYQQHYALVVLAEIGRRFTVHGLRDTFTDLVHRANVDAVARRALTGHVTEEMQRKYSTVGLDEKRAAVAGVIRLVPPERSAKAKATANDERADERPAVGPGVGPTSQAGLVVRPALEAGTAAGPALETGTAVGSEVGPNAEAGRAVGPKVGRNPSTGDVTTSGFTGLTSSAS